MNRITLENLQTFSYDEYVLLPKKEKKTTKAIYSLYNKEHDSKKIIYLENQKIYDAEEYYTKPKLVKSTVSNNNLQSKQKNVKKLKTIFLENQDVFTKEEYLAKPKSKKSITNK
ncbi:hypothetical protein [Xanthomarina sp. F2636L]|uniref:hypothetical protein n=1 Tax=Xanthomarina sp. F2636L TaxID=2996018 RepID=UPI00225DE1FC|nr:hypothetical protein [Xanthomarina sp. F2636L]MCX7550428.1 hypothetical protein [Xanthomarina sp. F2636L]